MKQKILFKDLGDNRSYKEIWDLQESLLQENVKLKAEKRIEARSQEVGDRRQERGDRSQEIGDRSEEIGDRSQERGVRSEEPGDRSQEIGDRRQERGDRSEETGDRSEETGDRSEEIGDRSQEPGDRSQEPGDRSQEIGDRSQEIGDRNQKTEDRSNLTPYTPHLTPYTSHLRPHTSHLTPYTPHLIPHTPHLIPHTTHLIPPTSHLIPHTSHLIPITSQPATQNYLLFVEHSTVYTLGKSGDIGHVLIDEKERQEKGIEFFKINRGGDITFHGPGQLVGYPIFDLDNFKTDLGWYLRNLEEVIILTMAEYGLKGDRSKGETGVWMDPDVKGKERKICAMGIRCSRWITMHGFAFNINTDLNYFNHIIPCGIKNKQVTSLQKELGYEVPMAELKEKVKNNFAKVFNADIAEF